MARLCGVQFNAWHHTDYILAGVKAGRNGSLYINGEKLGDLLGSEQSPNAVHNSDPIYIGGAGVGKSMDGTICEIIVYDNGISDADSDAINAYLAKKWGVAGVFGADGKITIDGEEIPAFNTSQLNYKHTLAYGTTDVPKVDAEFDGA